MSAKRDEEAGRQWEKESRTMEKGRLSNAEYKRLSI